eukprot:4253804-Karenia_brevis.AAC.1
MACLAVGSASSTYVSTCVAHFLNVLNPSSLAKVGGSNLGFLPSNILANPVLESLFTALPSIARILFSISIILWATLGWCPFAKLISEMMSWI